MTNAVMAGHGVQQPRYISFKFNFMLQLLIMRGNTNLDAKDIKLRINLA
jgi:hypothetical protein